MKTVGIIVEYNPLHYGHVYHFRQSAAASEADAVIAVMSGNFLQRGEPALVNKWARAEMALRMGADMVIELPVAYSSQPAEWFAYGAVSILEFTGVVDSLCFGSESGEIEWLQMLAKRLQQEPISFQKAMKRQLKKGINYPAAYSAAISEYADEMEPEIMALASDPIRKSLGQPNNILGLHYLIALARLNSRIRPLTITRHKAGFHQTDITDNQVASATAIRRILAERNDPQEAIPYIPVYTYDILCREWEAGRAPIQWESFAVPLIHQLISKSAVELSEIYEVSEGLENRIKQVLPLLKEPSVEQLLQCIKTKRFTRTKLQRTLLRILLNHSKAALSYEMLKAGPSYLRILGFSQKGQLLLKKMKQTSKVPIVTKVTREPSPLLDLDIRATSIYSLAYREASTEHMLRDYYEPPIRL